LNFRRNEIASAEMNLISGRECQVLTEWGSTNFAKLSIPNAINAKIVKNELKSTCSSPNSGHNDKLYFTVAL